ncbi:MAG TPA: beta-N-acetylhexosaminidase [bacterium]|nr:beta-N-acetylhexosaminidase [bacterium]
MKRIFGDVAKLFVWGFEGMSVSSRLKALLRAHPIAGVVLFKRNIATLEGMRALNRDLKKIGGRRFLIAIDEEGGRVSRLPAVALKFPPAAFWGKLFEREKDLRLVTRMGRLLGRELKSVGVNLDFAPVLDVNSNPQNPIIGDRAFSGDPKTAALVALAFERGLRREGILTCGKHFPGHGDTTTDSHRTLPKVRRVRVGLERVEILPFRKAAAARIPMLMTAHVVYPALDPKLPATLSPRILQGLLRKEMGYRGVVISDDLQMKAISRKYAPDEAAVLALEAGCDLLLVCEGFEKMGTRVMEKTAREVSKSPLLRRRLTESLARVVHLKVGS